MSHSSEYKAVLRRGGKAVSPRLIVWAAKQKDGAQKFGMIVSKRNIGNAVHRNRVKRRLREIYRLNRHLFPTDLNVVVIARKPCNNTSFSDLSADFIKSVDRIVIRSKTKAAPDCL